MRSGRLNTSFRWFCSLAVSGQCFRFLRRRRIVLGEDVKGESIGGAHRLHALVGIVGRFGRFAYDARL